MSSGAMSWEEAVRSLRDDPTQLALVEACFFDDPLIDAARRYRDCGEWRAVRNLIGSRGAGRAALDVGAGRGISSFALAKDGWRVSALEPDPSDFVGAGAIRSLAGESGHRIEAVQDWGESLPFADRAFDLVHARQVLHHAHDLEALSKEMARVLRPGGVYVCTREHVISKEEDLDAFLDSHPLHHLYGGEHAYTLDRYLSALTSAGLVVERALGPWDSDIKLFPMTIEDIRQKIASRLLIPARALPAGVVRAIGRRMNTPGRSYSFVGVKE